MTQVGIGPSYPETYQQKELGEHSQPESGISIAWESVKGYLTWLSLDSQFVCHIGTSEHLTGWTLPKNSRHPQTRVHNS